MKRKKKKKKKKKKKAGGQIRASGPSTSCTTYTT
jgi:hypothetical protein